MGRRDSLKEFVNRRETKEIIVLVLLVVNISFAIVYSNIQTFDSKLTIKSGYTDVEDYIAMFKGEPGSSIRGYRPLVPWMARAVPDFPPNWFTENREFDENYQIAIKFGVVNFFFLCATCFALYLLLRKLGISYFISLIGVFLFLGSQTVIRIAGLPMTDMAFLFFFTVALIAIFEKNFWLLLFAASIGVLAKELMMLCIPIVLITPMPKRDKGKMLLATLPAIGIYALVRVYLPNSTPSDGYINGDVIRQIGNQLRHFTRINGWINLFWAFGLAWIPAIYALFMKKIPKVLKMWSLLVPLVYIGILLGAGNIGRSLFTAAPVVIALAAFGIQGFLENNGTKKEESILEL